MRLTYIVLWAEDNKQQMRCFDYTSSINYKFIGNFVPKEVKSFVNNLVQNKKQYIIVVESPDHHGYAITNLHEDVEIVGEVFDDVYGDPEQEWHDGMTLFNTNMGQWHPKPNNFSLKSILAIGANNANKS